MGKTLKGIVIFLVVLIVAVCAGGVIAFAYSAFMPVAPNPEPEPPADTFLIDNTTLVNPVSWVENPLSPHIESDLFNPPVFEPGNPVFEDAALNEAIGVSGGFGYPELNYRDLNFYNSYFMNINIRPFNYITCYHIPYVLPLEFVFYHHVHTDNGWDIAFADVPESWAGAGSFFSLQRYGFSDFRISSYVKTANQIYGLYDYDYDDYWELALLLHIRFVRPDMWRNVPEGCTDYYGYIRLPYVEEIV